MEWSTPHSWQNRICLWILILLSFTGVNLIKIGKAMLTPFHVLMGGMMVIFFILLQKNKFRVSFSLSVLMSWIILVNVFNYHSLRVTSFIYTTVYFIEFLILFNLIHFIERSTVKKAFVFILYSYGINILLGTILLLLHLELPIIKEFIRTYTIVETGEGRPMGFSTEPSYAGVIVSVAYLCYNHLNHHRLDKQTKYLSFVYLISILLLRSAYGFLFLGLNLIDGWIWSFKKGSIALRKFMMSTSFFFIIGGGFLFQKMGNESIQRIEKIVEVFASSQWTIEKKMKKFQEIDASGFARVGPSYLLYVKRSTYNQNMWLGGGAGQASIFLPKFLEGILIDEGSSADAGIIPSFIIDYGLIGFGLLLLFLATCFYNLPVIFWISFGLMLPNANVNTQLFWFVAMAFFLVSNFKNRL